MPRASAVSVEAPRAMGEASSCCRLRMRCMIAAQSGYSLRPPMMRAPKWPVMKLCVPMTCPEEGCWIERTTLNRSASRASRGRISQKRIPGSAVGMASSSPRYSAGADGLGSKVSWWLGPPSCHSRMIRLGGESAWLLSAEDSARSRRMFGSENAPRPPITPARARRRVQSANSLCVVVGIG